MLLISIDTFITTLKKIGSNIIMLLNVEIPGVQLSDLRNVHQHDSKATSSTFGYWYQLKWAAAIDDLQPIAHSCYWNLKSLF